MEFSIELFAERLRDLRQDQNLPMERLAQLVSIDSGTISRYENALRMPTAANIYTLSRFFKVPSDYLLGLSD